METKKFSLYDINAEQKALIAQIMDAEGEITPELEESLKLTEANRNQKSIAYLEVLAVKKMRISMIDDEVKRLTALKKQETKTVETLEGNLLEAVKTFGEYSVGMNKFGTRKSSSVIVEVDPLELPEIYRTQKLVVTADKKALKDAIDAGAKIEGVYIQNNLNLKIN